MPWTIADVDEHSAGLSDDLERVWVRVANERLQACLETHAGEVDEAQRKQCEGSAIRQANAAVRRAGRNKEQSYKPTRGMVAEAKRGLAWRREHGRGGTEVGIARARDISGGKNLSLSTVKRMHSFFSRHEVDKQGKGFKQGEKGYPSNGRIAWALWGGDAGQSWARRIAEREDKEMDEKALTKRVGNQNLPASSFLVVEDREETSTWHLPVKSASGEPDRTRMGAAWAALHKGYRGNKYEGPNKRDAIRKLRALYKQIGAEPPSSEKGLLLHILDYVKSLLDDDGARGGGGEPSFMHWKEADGTVRWIARYSNNIRDEDDPPEIISSASHQRFVDLVDNKAVAAPELWLWHRPEWKLGHATWVAYDDSGFALAGGMVDEKGTPILEHIASLPPQDVRVSHGMPSASIKRDDDDPTIIVEHITREISPLPTRWAANKGTGFAILKEQTMGIPTEKRQALLEQWGLSEEQLDGLEAANAATAEAAKEAGLESKEADVAEDAETSEAKEQETEQAETEEEAVGPDPLTREEIAEAFMAVMQPLAEQVGALQAQLVEQSKALDELKQSDAQKIAQKAADTPAASLLDLMAKRAVGNAEAREDGRSKLAQSKPKETEHVTKATGIPFIDQMVSGQH